MQYSSFDSDGERKEWNGGSFGRWCGDHCGDLFGLEKVSIDLLQSIYIFLGDWRI